MEPVPPLYTYLVKIIAGTVAFLVWILSVIQPPVLAIDPAAQAVLFGAAVVAFGWGVLQGGQTIRSTSR